MSKLDPSVVKHRSITGAIFFTSRTALLQIISLVAFFLLSSLLSPAEIGIFVVVEATVSFLIYFSDIGLAAALIQKTTPLTKKDLITTFTIQQTLVITLVSVALFFSPLVADFFHYGQKAQFLFQALVIAFLFSSLKTIPSILLERDLEFNKLILPQIIENIVFYLSAVVLAYKGYGITSYTIAVLLRAIIGLVTIYLIKPWMPRIGFDRQVAKKLTSFGAPFQLNSILALFKDKALIIFLGRVLPAAEVGYLGWAEKWGLMPIRFFADPVLRVTFPAYSRLQRHPLELKKAIEKSIFFVSILVFPAIFGLIGIGPSLVTVIPKYSKWQPALIALTFYSINALFSSISITLTNTLNATGKVKTTLKLMIMWTILTWILTPTLIHFFGFNGVAIASALTASSSLIAIYLIKNIVHVSIWPQVATPLLASAIMFVSLNFLTPIYATSLLHTLAIALVGAVIYAVFVILIDYRKIILELLIVKKYLTRH